MTEPGLITKAQIEARQALIDAMAESSIRSPEQMADMVLDGLEERGFRIERAAQRPTP